MFAASKTAAVASAANYIEDVFSTYLYTGNSTTGGTQTITNNIDLSTKGGMVWIKGRNSATNHILTDTTRGAGVSATNNQALSSNLSNGEDLGGFAYDYLSAFNSNGFAVTQGGTATARYGTNYNGTNYCSWTFRKQQKFFDIVTYTGNGGANRAISHNLGSVPGAIIIKQYSSGSNWPFYHRSIGSGKTLLLNDTGSTLTNALYFPTTPTATDFYVSDDGGNFNTNGETYVAYIFAHDAGGFGAAGTDNVISCGSFTTDSGGAATVNLGYEPQFVLYKSSSAVQNWFIQDNMRGFPNPSANSPVLFPNLSNAESTDTKLYPTSTGFVAGNAALTGSATYIYIAIRRGPMKTPTSGASVFSLNTTAPATNMTVGFPADWVLTKRTGAAVGAWTGSRLQGSAPYLQTVATAAEASSAGLWTWDLQNVFKHNYGATPLVTYLTARAPGFFDVVCYTGTGANRTINHNLGVSPELIIIKTRNTTSNWPVYSSPLGATGILYLNLTSANGGPDATMWNSTSPTSTVFSLGTNAQLNTSSNTYVAYLFATVAGVSKVGSYTGNGSSQTINCGFAAGARFVMIKRTNSTGDWYVWDTARGMVAGNDPHLSLNTTAADVTTDDSVDTDSSGFIVNQVAATNVNVNAATYIFLAIA